MKLLTVIAPLRVRLHKVGPTANSGHIRRSVIRRRVIRTDLFALKLKLEAIGKFWSGNPAVLRGLRPVGPVALRPHLSMSMPR